MARPRVAAIVTEYTPRSHADVIVTKLLEGYDLHGVQTEPRLQVASLYLDQTPDRDIGRGLAAKHAVPVFGSIGEALALPRPYLDRDSGALNCLHPTGDGAGHRGRGTTPRAEVAVDATDRTANAVWAGIGIAAID